ncbi:MAG: DUF4288 domain-containing protein [Anaerolineaceae bacterium]|nr:DUF4288 domain-containing protein [Anaerolineaceae bacterium]
MSAKSSSTKPNKKRWFAATLIVRDRIEDHEGSYTCDEQIRLIHARTAEKAYKKAYKVGKAQETVSLNNSGEMVYCEFVGLQDLSLIPSDLADGAEIRSRIFTHIAPQELVHTQDELSIFGSPFQKEWRIIGEEHVVHDDK